jgi:hypothetical protein
MRERKNLKFAHRGYTLRIGLTNMEAGWYAYFNLKSPSNTKEATLWGEEGPYASAEEAFEKAKRWALWKIKQRTLPHGAAERVLGRALSKTRSRAVTA